MSDHQEESNEELRRCLHEAKEAGDISTSEYLKELKKLRLHAERGAASSSQHALQVSDEEEEEDLISESGLPHKRTPTIDRRRRVEESEAEAPDSAASRGSKAAAAVDEEEDEDKDEDESVYEGEFDESVFEPGTICTSTHPTKLRDVRLTVVRMGTERDFVNSGRVYVRYQCLKKG